MRARFSKACHQQPGLCAHPRVAVGLGNTSKAKKLPGAAGPAMVEWPDASNAEKLEYWLAHFRRKNWFTLGNEIEIVALFEGRGGKKAGGE